MPLTNSTGRPLPSTLWRQQGDKTRHKGDNPTTRAALYPTKHGKISVGSTLKCHKMSPFVLLFGDAASSVPLCRKPGAATLTCRGRWIPVR